jgi:hypothetical protein
MRTSIALDSTAPDAAVHFRKAAALTLALLMTLAPAAQAERTRLKPGMNRYSPEDDIKIGQSVSADAEKQLPMLNDAQVNKYLDTLGKRLATKAPGGKYPYQFKAVNEQSINAFALPGGFIYVHRGVIEAADNEAQLAGVIGHEIGHVAMRHGTNQATKAELAQGLLALGGAVAGGSKAGAAAIMAAGFGAQSVLLKYGRDAERQSDIIGTQILYDHGYDPRAMAQFFEKIEAASKGQRIPEFLSSHPNPGNRMQGVMKEVENIGGLPAKPKTDSAEFRQIKAYLKTLPAPKPGEKPAGGSGGTAAGGPPAPSKNMVQFENPRLMLQHPDNWKAQSQGDAGAILPENGALQDSKGRTQVAYGVLIGLFEPHREGNAQVSAEDATDQLIEELRKENPRMTIQRQRESVRIGRARAYGLSTLLVNDSPVGGRELDRLVTVLRPEGLIYLIFVVPEKDAEKFNPSFDAILSSIRFK